MMRDSASRHSRIGRAATVAWRSHRDRDAIDDITIVSSSSHRIASSSVRHRRRRDIVAVIGVTAVTPPAHRSPSRRHRIYTESGGIDRHCRRLPLLEAH